MATKSNPSIHRKEFSVNEPPRITNTKPDEPPPFPPAPLQSVGETAASNRQSAYSTGMTKEAAPSPFQKWLARERNSLFRVLKWVALAISAFIGVGVTCGTLQGEMAAPGAAALAGLACFFGIFARVMQAEEHFRKQGSNR